MKELDLTVFKENELLSKIRTLINLPGVRLVGGAVIDLLEGRKPKDYDFLGIIAHSKNRLIENGFEFVCETKTATTLKYDKYVLQLLKTNLNDFDYTISQASYWLKTEKIEIDRISFDTRTLIPTEASFNNSGRSINALKRMVHYQKKGYTLPEASYLSLLNNISIKGGEQS